MKDVPQARSEFRHLGNDEVLYLILNDPAVDAEHRRLMFAFTHYVSMNAKKPDRLFKGLMRRRGICAIELQALRSAHRAMVLSLREQE